MCGQVWCPILRVSDLLLTHPSAHTHMEQYCGARGAVGGLVPHLSPGIERVLNIHSPPPQSLPDLRLEPTTFGLQGLLSIL